MELTAENVHEVTRSCLPDDGAITREKAMAIKNGEPSDSFVVVEGIVTTMVFDKEKIEKRKEDIRSMLSELPETFREDKGGGWSFLNACMRQDGVQWSEHRDMESLFCLGIAAGLANWLMPKDLWAAMPGGMPYVAINIASEEEKGDLPSRKRLDEATKFLASLEQIRDELTSLCGKLPILKIPALFDEFDSPKSQTYISVGTIACGLGTFEKTLLGVEKDFNSLVMKVSGFLNDSLVSRDVGEQDEH